MCIVWGWIWGKSSRHSLGFTVDSCRWKIIIMWQPRLIWSVTMLFKVNVFVLVDLIAGRNMILIMWFPTIAQITCVHICLSLWYLNKILCLLICAYLAFIWLLADPSSIKAAQSERKNRQWPSYSVLFFPSPAVPLFLPPSHILCVSPSFSSSSLSCCWLTCSPPFWQVKSTAPTLLSWINKN